jgi:hypothetical protein
MIPIPGGQRKGKKLSYFQRVAAEVAQQPPSLYEFVHSASDINAVLGNFYRPFMAPESRVPYAQAIRGTMPT